MIPGFFRTLMSDEWLSGYLMQSSLFIQERIILILKELKETTSDTVKAEKLSIQIFELLEYQIFYLLDFQNIELYLSKMSDHMKDKNGQVFLQNYFSRHPMSALQEFFHGEVQATDTMENT